jgi:hypothetical protein
MQHKFIRYIIFSNFYLHPGVYIVHINNSPTPSLQEIIFSLTHRNAGGAKILKFSTLKDEFLTSLQGL